MTKIDLIKHIYNDKDKILNQIIIKNSIKYNDAEDIFQEAMIRLYLLIDEKRIEHINMVYKYFWKTITTIQIDTIRKWCDIHLVELISGQIYIHPDEFKDDDNHLNIERMNAIKDILLTAPIAGSEIIQYRLKNLTQKEICEITGIGLNAVKSRTHRIMKYLMSELNLRGFHTLDKQAHSGKNTIGTPEKNDISIKRREVLKKKHNEIQRNKRLLKNK